MTVHSNQRGLDAKFENNCVNSIFQVCVVSATLVQFFANDNLELARNLDNILCLFNPLYPLIGCLNCITKVTFERVTQFPDVLPTSCYSS